MERKGGVVDTEERTHTALNSPGMYDDPYKVEIYDQSEDYSDDVELILSLLPDDHVRVLEPFCGNGRILLPIAQAGFQIHGIDRSLAFLSSLRSKIAGMPAETRRLITTEEMDLVGNRWPEGFDIVVLGGNCLYELATEEEQLYCISQAARSLRPGGSIYLDNNHMEGALDSAWINSGVQYNAFPSGVCADRTAVSSTREVIWHNAEKRLIHFLRKTKITRPDGTTSETEWIQRNHPPSTEEMTKWLESNSMRIRALWGDRTKAAYREDSPRAIFWAEKREI